MQVCTIAARNYLPFVHVLAESFSQAHRGERISALIVDGRRDDPAWLDQPFDVVLPDELDLDSTAFHHMAMAYDVTELSTSLKPWMLRHLIDRGADVAVYLDPDIQVHGAFPELHTLATENGMVLTPHTLSPIPRDGLRPTEADILGAGVYNLGFIAVAKERRDFLLWWSERLRRDSISDPARMLFTDQRWVDFAPSYFAPGILRDPGFNVAYWNLFERPLARTADGVLAAGVPLRFFHFSGFRPDSPWILSKYVADRPRSTISSDPVLRELCEEYGQAVLAAGFEHETAVPYGWNHLADGTRVSPRVRRYFRAALLDWEGGQGSEPPDPFGPGGPEAFHDWLRSPVSDEPGCLITRAQHAAWSARADLQSAFPRVLGADQRAFLHWVSTNGLVEEGLEPPTLPEALVPPEPADVPGFNIAGYFHAELGVGKLGRILVASAQEAGIPYATVNNSLTLSRQDHPFSGAAPADRHFPVNLIAVNADALPGFVEERGAAFFHDTYNIGMWAWEVEEFPESLHGAFDLVDEVWAISDFTRDAIAAHTDKPVLTFPMPIEPVEAPAVSRADLDLPEGFLFLFTFDYLSVAERKNPFDVIEAFSRAFAPGEGPHLVVKGINGHLKVSERERLRFQAAGRPDVILIEDYLDSEQTLGLLSSCDVFVSLHRCEGYGLAIAEAMAMGKPVITTAYSGSTDFTNPDVALLVPYELVSIPASAEPYPVTSRWAQPDVEAAAAHMRFVFDRPQEAQQIARRGQEHVLTTFPLARSAAFVSERLSVALDRMAERRAEPQEDTTPPLVRLVQETQQRISDEPPTSGRGLRNAYHRALTRLLRGREARVAAQLESLRDLGAALADQAARHESALGEQETRLVRARQELAVGARALRHGIEQSSGTGRELRALQAQVQSLSSRVQQVAAETRSALELTQSAHQRLDEGRATSTHHERRFDDVAARLDALDAELGAIDAELAAEPFRSSDALLSAEDHTGRATLGFSRGGAPGSYASFEDVFRGSSDFVYERLLPYAPLLKGRDPVLDLGCGRGEFLRVLRDQGIPASGVDQDRSMVERALGEGLAVSQGDALAVLRGTEPGTLGAVTSFQVVEHLTPEQVRQLFEAALHTLRPGGVLIAETVNPHSPPALKAFWLDITHVRPLYPESLLFLAQECGYSSASITFVHGGDDLKQNLRRCGEYALVAYKAA